HLRWRGGRSAGASGARRARPRAIARLGRRDRRAHRSRARGDHGRGDAGRSRKNGEEKVMKKRVIVCLVALAATSCGKQESPALQGYAEGEYVRVAAPFAGTLVSLDAQRGARVEAGAPLFALEAENEDAARREARERLRKAGAVVEDLR